MQYVLYGSIKVLTGKTTKRLLLWHFNVQFQKHLEMQIHIEPLICMQEG